MIKDQADQLRDLVNKDSFKVLGLNPVNIFSIEPGEGKSLFSSQLTYLLSHIRKKRVLLAEEVKNAIGFCGIPRFLGMTPGQRAPIEFSERRVRYIPFYGPLQHTQQIEVESEESGQFDYSFIESQNPIRGTQYGILVVSTDFEIKNHFENWYQCYSDQLEQFERLGVVVSKVTNGAQGSEFFRQLNDVIVNEGFRKFDYLGHIPVLKNTFRSLKKEKSLIELDKGNGLASCLSLILKRMTHWKFRSEAESSVQKIVFDKDVEARTTMDW